LESSQKQIIVITLFLIIGVSTSIAYFNWQISEDQKKLIINHKQNRVSILQTSIHERFSSHIEIIEETLLHSTHTKFSQIDKINPELNGVPEFVEVDQRQELRNLLQNNPRFESIGLFLPNGDIYLAEPFSSQLNLLQKNYAFRDWYDGAINTIGVYVSEPYETHYTNEKTIALSMAIRDGENIVGIFHTTLQLDFLRKLIDVQIQEPETMWYFVDENGKIGMARGDQSEYDEEFFSKLIHSLDSDGGYFQEEFFGKEQLVVYDTSRLGTKDWFLFLIQPSKQAFTPIVASQYLTQSLLMVSIVVISGFGYIVFWQNTKNITIRKQLEKSNQKLSLMLEKSHEVDREKEEFSAMITHELKTPLVPILGHVKMLSKKDMIGNLNEEQLGSVQVIERNAKRLEKLINDIMDARKLDIDKMKFDIDNVVLDEFLANLKSNYQEILNKKDIEFVLDNQTQGIILNTDADRVRQVFGNLISNSIKFVPSEKGKIIVGATIKDDFVQFHVKDNGIGISKDKQSHLFQKFYQIDTTHTRKIQGTGLGLVICKGIIEKIGGKIWVESDGKNGSTFFFTLPIKRA